MKLRTSIAVAFFLALASNGLAAGIEIGDKAPDFTAIGVDGKDYDLASASDAKATVVCFTCNRCPVAIGYEDRFIEFSEQYKKKNVRFIAINVNPESMDDMRRRAEEKGFPFAYCKDDSGESARSFGARVTPHVFVLDGKQELAYVGAFDDNLDESRVKAHYVAEAVDAILSGKKVKTPTTSPVGCRISLPRR
jgi:peroxiredoxin